MTVSSADLVRLHLSEVASPDDRPAPRARSVDGICDAIGERLGDDRLDVLSTLDRLVAEGHLETKRRSVAGLEGERTVYELTEAGRERARALRDDLAEETVILRRDGNDHTVSLEEIDAHLDVASPLVTALIERDEDGVLELDDESAADRLVGRDRELHLLENVVWRSDEPPAGAVIAGPSGVGKTALIAAFVERVRESGGRVLSASAGGDGSEAYGLFRELLEGALGEEASPFAAVDGTDADSDSYEARRKSFFYDVFERLDALAEERPTLLVLDDLEGATAASLDLLSYVVDRLEWTDLRLVCACNTGVVESGDRVAETLAEITAAETVDRIDLEALSRDGVAAYVEWLLETEDAPADFVDRIYERTGGNPLFVTALVRHLEEEGFVDPAADAYPETESASALPDTVRAVIDARLESLADEHVSILEAAAVVGERASVPVLAGVLDRDEADLREAVDDLVDGELCEAVADEAVPLSRTVRFRNPVIREAVLERVDDDRRVELHERVAQAVLSVELTGAGTTHAAAARHFERAGDDERALEHYRNAGDRAFDVYAHETALEHYERTLDLARAIDREEDRLDCREKLGDVERTVGEYDAAESHYRAVLERADDIERRLRTTRKLATLSKDSSEYDRALSLADRGLALAEEPSAEVFELLNVKGTVRRKTSQYDEALETFERLTDLADEVDDEKHRIRAVHGMGLTWNKMGDLERAEPLMREALERARSADYPGILASASNNLGLLHNRRNDYEAALSCYERARDHHEEIGDVRAAAINVINIGIMYKKRGDTERALEHYERALETARRIADEYMLTSVLQNIASLHRQQGELDACLETLATARKFALESGIPKRLAQAKWNEAWTHYYGGSVAEAADVVDRLVEIARETDDEELRVGGLTVRGALARYTGDAETAVDHHLEAIALANENGLDEYVLTNRLRLVLDYAVRGDADGALEQAEAIESLATEYDAETAALARGVAARLAGDYEAAADALETALEESREKDDCLTAFRVREQQARLALARGDVDRARDLATALRDDADERGLGLFVEHATDVLEDCQ